MPVKRAMIKIRRGAQWNVRPIMDELDGKTFEFIEAGKIEDRVEYDGETAWMFGDEWPSGAPAWIASGDLVFID